MNLTATRARVDHRFSSTACRPVDE